VIVARNSWTMPQERYNTEWIRDHHLGLVLRSFRTIGPAVQELGSRLDEFKASVRRTENRAVFEVPQILARLLARHQSVPMRPFTAAAHPAHLQLQ